jgi:hypothetical protein
MKLDRNGPAGRGKYAVVKLRKMPTCSRDEVLRRGPAKKGDYAGAKNAVMAQALELLIAGGFVAQGSPGDDDEFFVIMLKDRYAGAALVAYADAAAADGEIEYAADVMALSARAGAFHPGCKKPD